VNESLKITLMTGGVVFWFAVLCAIVVCGACASFRIKQWWEDKGHIGMRIMIGWAKIFSKRVLRRFIHLLRFKEMWMWEHESCNRCGSCYRLPTGWVDDKWISVNGKKGGRLCFDCFVTLAQKKCIPIDLQSIERMGVFDPLEVSGGSFDIIKSCGNS